MAPGLKGVDMAVFKVLKRVDAFVDYVAEIEAGSAEEAAELALDQEEILKWRKDGMFLFDSRVFVTLDEDGLVIDNTRQGDPMLLGTAPRSEPPLA